MVRSHKCFCCKKYLGNSFADFPKGTVDTGEKMFCNDYCYFQDWLNCWGNSRNDKLVSRNNHFTNYGKGYHQAIRDVFTIFKKLNFTNLKSSS